MQTEEKNVKTRKRGRPTKSPDGKTMEEVAAEHGVCRKTLHNWSENEPPESGNVEKVPETIADLKKLKLVKEIELLDGKVIEQKTESQLKSDYLKKGLDIGVAITMFMLSAGASDKIHIRRKYEELELSLRRAGLDPLDVKECLLTINRIIEDDGSLR